MMKWVKKILSYFQINTVYIRKNKSFFVIKKTWSLQGLATASVYHLSTCYYFDGLFNNTICNSNYIPVPPNGMMNT
jgi:hypothetical protein